MIAFVIISTSNDVVHGNELRIFRKHSTSRDVCSCTASSDGDIEEQTPRHFISLLVTFHVSKKDLE